MLRDGWYRSGDVVAVDAAGLVSIVGREREMLISGGLNVYPAEVEAVLHRHPGISEAAVFGVPDDLWGEVVAAAIVTRTGQRDERGGYRRALHGLARRLQAAAADHLRGRAAEGEHRQGLEAGVASS